MYVNCHKLYTLLHHDFVTSIQIVQAIDINAYRLQIDTNCLVVVICIYIVQKALYVINFLVVAQTSKFINISFSSC